MRHVFLRQRTMTGGKMACRFRDLRRRVALGAEYPLTEGHEVRASRCQWLDLIGTGSKTDAR